MRGPRLHLVVPGPLDQRTGGYLYDARMARELERLAWELVVHNLEGRFPGPDSRAEACLAATLEALPAGSRVLVDGLALGGHPGPASRHAHRLLLLGLVHHPLADETGLDPASRSRLLESESRALAACAGVVVTSGWTARRLAELGVPEERVRVVIPGVDRAPPARGPEPRSPVSLLCVGTLCPRKGQDVLVTALSRLRDRPWRCTLAGSITRDPDYAASVREQAEAAGLGGRIRFEGECEADRLAALYGGASVFVLPSHYEGYGMALTEALIRGLPVVATTGGAIPSTVPPGAGILVPPGDVEALAAALAALLPEADEPHPQGGPARTRRELMARQALHHARSLPDWSQAGRHFAHAVLALAPEGRPPVPPTGPGEEAL